MAHDVSNTPIGVPLHPTQIYDALLNLALYGFLAWLFLAEEIRWRDQEPATYLICYAITRSIRRVLPRRLYQPALPSGPYSSAKD